MSKFWSTNTASYVCEQKKYTQSSNMRSLLLQVEKFKNNFKEEEKIWQMMIMNYARTSIFRSPPPPVFLFLLPTICLLWFNCLLDHKASLKLCLLARLALKWNNNFLTLLLRAGRNWLSELFF